ncbi:MAG TPA: PCP reductase family protein [Longimicrobiales bacterium]
MKFLCVKCDTVMNFAERQLPGDGTMAAVFTCASCQHEVAMLTNPMETQLVASLGVKVGGRTIDEQPFELIRSQVANGGEVFDDVIPRPVRWSEDAVARLERVPSFVRGMVKRIYTDYARERSIAVIDVAVMDRARVELGLEGM